MDVRVGTSKETEHYHKSAASWKPMLLLTLESREDNEEYSQVAAVVAAQAMTFVARQWATCP